MRLRLAPKRCITWIRTTRPRDTPSSRRRVRAGSPPLRLVHLQKSLNDFNKGMTHIAKMDVGESQKGAVDDVNHGIKELNDAVTALDNGNMDSAQAHYDRASTSFSKAASILD